MLSLIKNQQPGTQTPYKCIIKSQSPIKLTSIACRSNFPAVFNRTPACDIFSYGRQQISLCVQFLISLMIIYKLKTTAIVFCTYLVQTNLSYIGFYDFSGQSIIVYIVIQIENRFSVVFNVFLIWQNCLLL